MKKLNNQQTNLNTFEETKKFSELSPTEIISALLGCTNHDEVTVLLWRNFDTFEANPELYNVYKFTRYRIEIFIRACNSPLAYLLN